MNNKQGIIVHVVIAWVVVMASWSATAQPAGSDVYRYSCVGNCERLNSHAKGAGGLMLAGGGQDVDAAFKWFIGQAGGGDLVVLRTSGGDGYDRYLYELVPGGLNSVSTFVMAGTAAAHDEFLLSKVANATAIFWAGGDQWTYYSYVKQTPLQEALQHAISPPFSTSSPPPSFTSRYPSRNAVYGGTSAVCIDSNCYSSGDLFFLIFLALSFSSSSSFKRDVQFKANTSILLNSTRSPVRMHSQTPTTSGIPSALALPPPCHS